MDTVLELCLRGLFSRFSLALCLLFSLSFANKIATIYASRLLQLHIHFALSIPVSLNSLDREGARLLSPCGSQITHINKEFLLFREPIRTELQS